MQDYLASFLGDRSNTVVRNGLAARQWEAHLLEQPLRRGRRTWLSPKLLPYSQWLRELWAQLPSSASQSSLLSAEQSQALWRAVIRDSSESTQLLSQQGPAVWAADAWRLLTAWQLDVTSLRAQAQQDDFGAFLNWCKDYRRRLRDAAWLDEPTLTLELTNARLPAATVATLADLHDCTPSQRALFERLRSLGWEFATRAVPSLKSAARQLQANDEHQELQLAANWAGQQLSDSPEQRIALVIGDSMPRRSAVKRALESAVDADSIGFARESPLIGLPVISAALCGIELFTSRATFATLSRWLRSPFFHEEENHLRSIAALAETRLRAQIFAQLPFLQAYREGGLAQFLAGDAAPLASKLNTALGTITPYAADRTPSHWARLWRRCLQALGWPVVDTVNHAVALQAFDRALMEFSALTAILGSISASKAIAEFESILRRVPVTAIMPLYGVHVLEHIDDIGPGYRRAWVTGMTATNWPEPSKMNPLLPRTLQVQQQMPWCTPSETLRRALKSTQRLSGRVSELIFSWPGRVADTALAPSGLIDELPERSPGEFVPAGNRVVRTQSSAARSIEICVDRAVPLTTQRIKGGSRTLDLQARSPLRAFCDSRLGARSLQAVNRGLSPRVQGLVVHRALELLLHQLPSQDEMCAATEHDRNSRITQVVERALAEEFKSARKPLAALFALEQTRLVALIDTLIAAEQKRSPFAVIQVEQRGDIDIGGFTLATRVDRIDRLQGGGAAIIDYKTGRSLAGPDWFSARLHDTQLPLYALSGSAQELVAVIIIALQSSAIRYKGFWPSTIEFAARRKDLPEQRSWLQQLDIWRKQIEQLVAEFSAGDVRIFADELDAIVGDYAPLSRVYEFIAQQRANPPT